MTFAAFARRFPGRDSATLQALWGLYLTIRGE